MDWFHKPYTYKQPHVSMSLRGENIEPSNLMFEGYNPTKNRSNFLVNELVVPLNQLLKTHTLYCHDVKERNSLKYNFK